MFTKKRLLSLLVSVLMLVAAAITVNKSIAGHMIEPAVVEEKTVIDSDKIITVLPDGGAVINTTGLTGTATGYAGQVPVEIHISDGKISEIKMLPNVESPSFFKRATTIVSAWIGKTPAEALDMRVDAVSGATYSSNAIISNVNAGLAYYEGKKNNTQNSIPLKIWIAFGVTLAACVIPLFVKNKLYHNAQLVANVVILGFWSGQFLDYALILKYISTGFMLPTGLVAIVMLVSAFIYPIFGRSQHYCTHICPLGSAQQLMGQICGYKIHISASVLRGLDWFRKILWAVLMLFLWGDCLTGWMDLELFQAFQFESAPWGIIVAACLFVVLSTIVSRPYCRFICPVGSLFKRAENIG